MPGKNVVQKILARAARRQAVETGEYLTVTSNCPVTLLGDTMGRGPGQVVYVAHHLARQHRLGERLALEAAAEDGGDRAADLGKIGGAPGGEHTGHPRRLGDVDADDARVRLHARTRPRRSALSRLMLSTKRPWPRRSRRSSLRRGEVPIMPRVYLSWRRR